MPQDVSNIHHSSDTYQVYEPGRAIGDVSPTLPDAPTQFIPDVDDGGGCGVAQVIITIVAIVVAVYTGIYVGAELGFGAVAGGAAGAAAGSIVQQGLSIAAGLQDSFSFKDVAIAALGGAITAGLSEGLGALAGSEHALSGLADNAIFQVAARNVVNQGINVALGEQQKFEWKQVAISVVSAGVSRAIGKGVGLETETSTPGEEISTLEFALGKGNFVGTTGTDFDWSAVGRNTAYGAIQSTVTETLSSKIYGREFNWAGVASSVAQTAVESALSEQERAYQSKKQDFINNGAAELANNTPKFDSSLALKDSNRKVRTHTNDYFAQKGVSPEITYRESGAVSRRLTEQQVAYEKRSRLVADNNEYQKIARAIVEDAEKKMECGQLNLRQIKLRNYMN